LAGSQGIEHSLISCPLVLGFYMDDCGVAKAMPDDSMVGISGYRPWIYNPDGEKKLWADSLDFVGLKDDL